MHTGEESMRNSKGDFVGGDLHHAHGMKGDGSPDLVEDGQPIIVAPVGRLKWNRIILIIVVCLQRSPCTMRFFCFLAQPIQTYTVKLVIRDHLSWRIINFCQKVLYVSVNEHVTKDHLSWETIFLWPMAWSFKTGSTVSLLNDIEITSTCSKLLCLYKQFLHLSYSAIMDLPYCRGYFWHAFYQSRTIPE